MPNPFALGPKLIGIQFWNPLIEGGDLRDSLSELKAVVGEERFAAFLTSLSSTAMTMHEIPPWERAALTLEIGKVLKVEREQRKPEE